MRVFFSWLALFTVFIFSVAFIVVSPPSAVPFAFLRSFFSLIGEGSLTSPYSTFFSRRPLFFFLKYGACIFYFFLFSFVFFLKIQDVFFFFSYKQLLSVFFRF